MLNQLTELLKDAEGRSEFVVAVVCDIRGFSAFGICHESPETAMFIKRFYLTLLEDYFSQAVYAKPTGDGLLLIFRYSERDLAEVSEYVFDSCFRTMADFPTMFAGDPMVNFATPSHLGFGIARGPACCLYAGEQIIDYSGHIITLASRLNDLARPEGIVVHKNYKTALLPASVRDDFTSHSIYIKSLAEVEPIEVLVSPTVVIPQLAMSPPSVGDTWTHVAMKHR